MWRKALIIVIQIMVLFIIAMIGTWIQQKLNLLIPGSVIGLVLLFTLLSLKIIPEKWVQLGASFMTKHLIFFYIPATVGIINYYQLFAGKSGLLLLVVTIVSTLIVFISSGYISEKLATRRKSDNG